MNLIRRLNRGNKFDPKNARVYPTHRHVSLAPKEDTQSDSRLTLPYFTSLLFNSVLEDVILKMRILMQINNSLQIENTMMSVGRLRSLKFSVDDHNLDEDVEINPEKLDCSEYKLNKLVEDREYITKVFLETYSDLCKRKFTSLHNHVLARLEHERHCLNLVEEERVNKLCRRELYKQLRSLRNQHKRSSLDVNQLIEELRIQLEHQCFTTALRTRYTESWERARMEQHTQTIKDAEMLQETTDFFKQKIEHEQRAHGEIELLTNIRINEALKDLSEWMVKFDKDMETIDLKIQLKKIEFQDIKEKRVELQNKLDEHAAAMANWYKYKKECEDARRYKELMHKSAQTVQAWWRGILLRKALGPYHPKYIAAHQKKNRRSQRLRNRI